MHKDVWSHRLVWTSAATLLLAGCALQEKKQVRKRIVYYVDKIVVVADERGSAPAQQIDLRHAMIPGERAQGVWIELHERRETVSPEEGKTNHELHLVLEAVLTRTGVAENGDIQGKLKLKQIRLQFGEPDKAGRMLSYDSSKDQPGKGNPLADVMTHVAAAECTLTVSPSGQLKELHGLDGLWRKAKLVLVPPGLVAAQWLFRDAGMGELVSESLFPPMPERPAAAGTAWESGVPANIPLAARLNARVHSKVTSLSPAPGGPIAQIDSAGGIVVPPKIYKADDPGIRPQVKSGSYRAQTRISAGPHLLVHSCEREMEIQLTLAPPAGSGQLTRTIKQERTLKSQRGDVSASAPAP